MIAEKETPMETFWKIALAQTNCYLLSTAAGYLLIDCGSGGDEQAFLSKIGRMGLSPRSINCLLLTHHHGDHCGLLPFLLSANPKIKVIMSEKCAAYLEAGHSFHPDTERCAAPALVFAMRLYALAGGKLKDTFRPYSRRAGDVILPDRDGMLSDFIDMPGSFMHTPGHTADSVSLIVGKNAFVGDAARNLLMFAAPYEPILHYDRETCRDSWRKLLAAGVKTVHPAHGKSFPAGHLERYV